MPTTIKYSFSWQLLDSNGVTVLWSPVGKPNVERIRRDDQLITNMMSNVTSLWIRVIAPEIFEMRVPRKLCPVILDL